MTILDHLPRSNCLQFDLPFDSIDVRFIMTFERDVSDREFVFTAENREVSTGAVSAVDGFSFSTTLGRNFVYVPKLAAGVEFRTKFFRAPTPFGRLYAELLPWSDRSMEVQKVLRGLAIELSTSELGMPAGWGRLVLPGKEIHIGPC